MKINIKIGRVMAIFLLVVVPTISIAEIIYVDANATIGGDGMSWATSYKYLYDALDKPPTSGDEIRVAQGIYAPAGAGGTRKSTFQLISGVAIKGGYTGLGEPDPNERDIETYETILSGDLDGNDIGEPNDPSRNENCYHVVTGSGSGTTMLDGVTITSGNANGSDFYDYNKGSGIYNKNGDLTLTNCTLTGNSARGGGQNCQVYVKSISLVLFLQRFTSLSIGLSIRWLRGYNPLIRIHYTSVG